MAVDSHANGAYSTVATAPSPATSGTSLTLPTGDGARFPSSGSFNCTVCATGAQPIFVAGSGSINAEIVRATRSGDVLTITRAQEGTTARSIVIGDQVFAGITARTLTDVEAVVPQTLRDKYLHPTACTYETMSRAGHSNSTQALTSGTLYLCAIFLPLGAVVSNITFVSATQAAVTPTNWWFGLYDSSRVQLATTANQTTTAWAASLAKTLNVATIASGASSTFTTTYEGLHYLGIMMTAATAINLAVTTQAPGVGNLTPLLAGMSDTGQTTPPAFAHTATAITASVNFCYAGVA